jgi:phage head maturation protease
MQLIRSAPDAKTLTVNTDKLLVRSIISTAEPDRMGDVVVPMGLRRPELYMRNPVVLWAHEKSMPPIGVCTKLEVEPSRVVAETEFSKTSTFAMDVFKLFAEGILRGWSIGFVPTKVSRITPSRVNPKGGMCYLEWDLLEYSAVPVPENPQALTLAVGKGMVKDADLRGWLIRDVLGALF